MDNNLNSNKNGTAPHCEKLKKDLVTRLNRIEGQVRGISKMVSENVYCDDVLHQIASVEAALTGVTKLLLEAHIRGCVVEQLANGDTGVIDELLVTIGKMIK
ncbi:MAG: CsoR family transcriptional regulator [Candidatus Margulisiibacteriota bacterium]|nr:MAG: CsoR family transcriptional regulator [Candidatus Margulisbacteria bacterium GWD2_39_127]OGI00875.1 MAG: CsoR family transcriptional regulator [Candidatus Margulisbacteria bacterium GWF2_38_17]OGI08730.1 MAG: CsoR family transcriptional regulator [Candidatus Margulisbacteria bacterium GWE2_39_32]PZM79441.1 MAG: CsoR family transcriptional regulator [Candidatus Margulisiibacteriota bacterium]HAR63506.1 CsoR family transcriptional regulator [Candidatus Margulisiibacteriota bacterium]